MLIPKTIHQIWVGDKICPHEQWIKTWQEKHPTWEHKMWTQIPKDFLCNQYINDCSSPTQISDIFRIEILLRYGGVYVDTDFECFKNIEPILQDHTIAMCDEVYSDAIFNGFMASIPNHPFFKKSLENIDLNIKNILQATGPIYIANIAKDFEIHKIKTKLLFPYMWDQEKPIVYPKDTYAAHHWTLSWCK